MQYANDLDQGDRQTDLVPSYLNNSCIVSPQHRATCLLLNPPHHHHHHPHTHKNTPLFQTRCSTGGRVRECYKSNAQQPARRRDRAGHKSNVLYCGDRGSERVTNQNQVRWQDEGGNKSRRPHLICCLSMWRGGILHCC